jgi:hypothetical protein
MQGQEGKPAEQQTSHRENPVGGLSCGVDNEGDAEDHRCKDGQHAPTASAQVRLPNRRWPQARRSQWSTPATGGHHAPG